MHDHRAVRRQRTRPVPRNAADRQRRAGRDAGGRAERLHLGDDHRQGARRLARRRAARRGVRQRLPGVSGTRASAAVRRSLRAHQGRRLLYVRRPRGRHVAHRSLPRTGIARRRFHDRRAGEHWGRGRRPRTARPPAAERRRELRRPGRTDRQRRPHRVHRDALLVQGPGAHRPRHSERDAALHGAHGPRRQGRVRSRRRWLQHGRRSVLQRLL